VCNAYKIELTANVYLDMFERFTAMDY